MTAEIELLLRYARAGVDEPVAVGDLRGLDWNRLLDAAATHGLGPMLYSRLRSEPPDGVPPAVLESLRDQFRAGAVQSLQLTGELSKLLDAFRAAGVPLAVFKGPLLARLYPNPAMRGFLDIDVLVRPADVRKAIGLILSLGYRPFSRLGKGDDTRFVWWNRECMLVREDGGGVFDLHWALAPAHYPCRPDFAAAWTRLVAVPLEGRLVPTLAPEDLLVVLCVHGAKHSWAALGWLCDISLLIAREPGLDWDAVQQRAREWQSWRALALGLLLAHDLLAAPVPQALLLAANADPAVTKLAAEVKDRLDRLAGRPKSVTENLSFHWRLGDNLWRSMRFVAATVILPTEADADAMPLPSFLFPAYYVLRPLRLLAKHAWLTIAPSRKGP